MARFICYGWNQKFRVKPLGMRFEVNKEKDRRALSGRKVPENLLLEWFSSNAWWQRLAWGPTVCCILFMLGLLWAPTVSRSLLVKASGSVAPRSLLSLRLFSQGKWRHSLWSRNSQPKFPSMYAYSLSLLQIHNISDKDIIFLKKIMYLDVENWALCLWIEAAHMWLYTVWLCILCLYHIVLLMLLIM